MRTIAPTRLWERAMRAIPEPTLTGDLLHG